MLRLHLKPQMRHVQKSQILFRSFLIFYFKLSLAPIVHKIAIISSFFRHHNFVCQGLQIWLFQHFIRWLMTKVPISVGHLPSSSQRKFRTYFYLLCQKYHLSSSAKTCITLHIDFGHASARPTRRVAPSPGKQHHSRYDTLETRMSIGDVQFMQVRRTPKELK